MPALQSAARQRPRGIAARPGAAHLFRMRAGFLRGQAMKTETEEQAEKAPIEMSAGVQLQTGHARREPEPDFEPQLPETD